MRDVQRCHPPLIITFLPTLTCQGILATLTKVISGPGDKLCDANQLIYSNDIRQCPLPQPKFMMDFELELSLNTEEGRLLILCTKFERAMDCTD